VSAHHHHTDRSTWPAKQSHVVYLHSLIRIYLGHSITNWNKKLHCREEHSASVVLSWCILWHFSGAYQPFLANVNSSPARALKWGAPLSLAKIWPIISHNVERV